MARRDPAKAYAAQGLPEHPVGTVGELLEHKMPTRIFQSCSEPTSDESNRGCKDWFDCTMSYKGLPVEEGGGPRAHCWERIKSDLNGGGIVRNCHPCYWGVEQQDVVSKNGEILQIIANEGEDYEMLVTTGDPAGGRDVGGLIKWDTKLVKLQVPSFKRIGQEQKLAVHELRASIIQRERDRLKNERPAKVLGIQGDDIPLDKRGRRSSSSTPKEG